MITVDNLNFNWISNLSKLLKIKIIANISIFPLFNNDSMYTYIFIASKIMNFS